MKIHNIRLGFATNSSSSHSLIFDPTISTTDDYEDFGWSFFTATSTYAKSQYMAATLYQNLSTMLPNSMIAAIMKGLGLDMIEPGEFTSSPHIDHQSLFNLPSEFNSDLPSLQFFDEFSNYILREGVHILGGNDNTEDTHPLYDKNKMLSLGGWQSDSSNVTCRKDGDWWTLYSRNTGHRIVLSFVENPAPFAPTTPMLMDVKITDFCTHGCNFCYQGSTTEGKHINDKSVWKYSNLITSGEVFEIAIGGGEPTQCPSFTPFVQTVHKKGTVVNFTTKSTDWLEDENRANEIIPYIGAFAYSAGEYSIETLNRIYTIFKYRKYDLSKFTVQIIPATMNAYQLETILGWCKEHYVRVTLLGFKESGRGAKFKEIAVKRAWDKFDEGKWLDTLEKLNKDGKLGKISIDTTMAAKYLDQLKSSNIPDWLYHVEEGKYSMYVDMVNDTYGPSSYHLDKLQPIDWNTCVSAESLFQAVDPV